MLGACAADGADVVLMADTNIDESVDGAAPRPSAPWRDAWLDDEARRRRADGDDAAGFTFDVERNAMVARLGSWASENGARLRYDRAWVRFSERGRGAVESVEIVATEPIAGSDPAVWPSDHFGIVLALAPGGPGDCDGRG